MIKVLKTEEDLVMLMIPLLDLLTLMPIIPAYVAPYLQDLFEVFSQVASWRYQHIQNLPQTQQIHTLVGLYAFFHRLYGMFPCNFLSSRVKSSSFNGCVLGSSGNEVSLGYKFMDLGL